jgi:N-sulfoglucosamine sulfohydrolase
MVVDVMWTGCGSDDTARAGSPQGLRGRPTAPRPRVDGVSASTPAGPGNRPNVVYLHTHDTGRYIGPYGAPVRTQRMGRVARDGMLFHRAFSAAPTCSPSRAALLTGQLPHNAGMMGLAHFGFRLHDPSQHLATTLRDAGYRTAMVGQQHVSADDEASLAGLGYIDVLRVGGHADEVSEIGAAFVRQHTGSADRGQPFFLSVGFFETHTDNRNEHLFGYPGDPDALTAPAPTMPSTPDTRREMASFAAAAAKADEGMGRVLDALDDAGVAENTLVVVTTDHGIAMPRMKCTLTDAGTGVMLIVRGPGGFSGGAQSEALVSHLDIFPTILELLGLDRPPWLQGHSLLPLTDDPTAVIRDTVIAEVTYHAAYEPQRTIRTGRYRYTRRFSDRGRPVLPNTDDSCSKDLWVRHGWASRRVDAESLWDEIFDPHEQHNLASEANHQPVLAELRARLLETMRDTRDPLLDGDVPAPMPDRQIDPDALSPKALPPPRG